MSDFDCTIAAKPAAAVPPGEEPGVLPGSYVNRLGLTQGGSQAGPASGSAASLWTGPVPHTTTLVKLVRRAGPAVIAQLNAALVGKLGRRQAAASGPQAAGGHHRGGGQHRLPTDADLLEHAVRKLGGLVRRIKARGRGQQDPVPRSWPCGRAQLHCAVRCGAVR
jgi:hypothetical protein